MDRREVLATLLAAPMVIGGEAEGQEQAGMDPSLYIPKAHVVEDRAFLHDFMDEYAFVDLVTTAPTLRKSKPRTHEHRRRSHLTSSR